MDPQSVDELRARIGELEEQLAKKDVELAELSSALDRSNQLAEERWQAIERLAPAAKRLRIERNELRAQLASKADP